ncbi:MAG: HAMP domain-containing protein, partial [Nitrospira sp.]|nr:HAMP domain-containing protein [Nitrospira sp.]
MFKTLYGKLTAVLLGLLCLIGILYVVLTLFTTRMYLQEVTQKLNRALAEHLVSEKILMREGQLNEKALEEIFHMLMVINPSIEVYLLDPNGSVLAFSAPPGKVKRQKVSLEPVKRFLSGTENFPILGDDPRDPNRKKIFSVSSIPIQGSLEGYLYVVLASEEYDSILQRLQGSYILRLSVWVAIASLLVAGLSGFLLFNLLTRRLQKLASAMEAFKRDDFLEHSNFPHPSTAQEGDEIDRLGLTFSEMSDRIIQQMKKLREIDALRRELVANVSHDLRTPLASL